MNTYATSGDRRRQRILAHVTDASAELEPENLMDIYARKSAKIAGRRGELSPSAQVGRGREWGDWNHLRVRKEWVEILSASKKSVVRPQYTKALEALAAGEIKTLWCYKLDRFDRRGALAVLSVLDNLDQTGARIVFGEDGLDSSDPNHRRMIMWKAEDAREEAARISQRVTDTKAWQRDHGEWVSGKVPYGLVADENRRLVPDLTPAIPGASDGPTRARVAQGVFRLGALGLSLRAITRVLHRYGIPSATGKAAWSANAVHHMLTNAAYSGWQIHCVGYQRGIVYTTAKGQRVRVGDPLVPDDQRRRAVRSLKGHSKPPKTYAGKATNLLTGLTRCTCGRAAPVSSRSYVCMSALADGGSCPSPASVFRPPLERYVAESWIAKLQACEPEDPLIIVAAQRFAALTRPEESAELQEGLALLREAEATLGRLLRDRRAGLYEGPTARFFEPAYADAMADYNRASIVVRDHSGTVTDISFLLDEQSAREAWGDADDNLRRDLLRLAIDRITLKRADCGADRARFDGDKRVTIKWAA